MDFIRKFLTQLGVWTAHPSAFAVLVAYWLAWIAFEPQTFDWHAVATLATWFMTLLIQRAEHRDTQAIHGKLDELLHAQQGARNAVTHLDEEEPEEIEDKRKMNRAAD